MTFNDLTDKLRQINGSNVSGGATPWEDMMCFLKINQEEPIVWHHSSWMKSNYDSEEIQLMTIMRCRKTK
jgi:hypothetical protein